MAQSVFNLTKSFDDEDFHLVSHVGLKDLLVNGLNDIIKCQRSLQLEVPNMLESIIELFLGKPVVNLCNLLRTWPSSDIVDCVDTDGVVRH